MLTERGICKAVLKFNHQGDIAQSLGVPTAVLKKAADAFKIPLPDGRKAQPFKDRNGEIVELRKEGATFLEIGIKFGMTKVRAGQIILECAPELSGHAFDKSFPVEFTCMSCGKKKATIASEAKKRIYCSQKCRGKDLDGGKGKLAYELRVARHSWRAIGEMLWDSPAAVSTTSARAATAVARYLKREGIKGTRAYGFDARGRHSGLVRNIKEQ